MQIPKYLNTDQELSGALDPGGVGRDLYRILEAAYTNDAQTVQTLLDKDPALGERGYVSNPIGFAVYGGAEDAVRTLLNAGVRPRSDMRFGDTLLRFSKARGDDGIYHMLLSELQNKYHYREDEAPVKRLFKAIADGDSQMVTSLISQHAGIATASDVHGATSLHKAAETNAPEDILKTLLRAGAVIQENTRGQTPIDVAFNKKSTCFIQHVTKPDTDDLTILAFLGKTQRLEQILKSKDIPEPQNHAWCPLSAASRTGNLKAVQIILKHFPNAWQPERQKRLDDALSAVPFNHFDIVKCLLEHGANPNNRPHTNNARHRKSEDSIELLIKYGGCVSPWDQCGDIKVIASLLYHAPGLARSEQPILIGRSAGDNLLTSGTSSMDVVNLLLKYGADPAPTSNWCNAYTWRHPETTARMLEHGADPNAPTMTGATPLHLIIIWRPYLASAEVLVKGGADINAVEELSGTTPLGWAAARGHIEAMQCFLSLGADPNPPVEPWATPLALAEHHKHQEAVHLLKKAI